MKQALITSLLIVGCATQPLTQVDIERANMEQICAQATDSKCEAAMQQYAKVITKQQNDPVYQFQQAIDETNLKYDSLRGSLKLQQQLRDMQLYGLGY